MTGAWKKRAAALAVLLALVAAGWFVYSERLFQNTSAARLPDESAGNIERYVSPNDADGDGIDDQTDILQSALAYVATKPKYKSKYYAGSGYPTDGFGVCTDVVAFALKGAGYDLRALVQQDIAAHPERYAIDEPDADIDFRRVRNLKVFFEHNALALTTNLDEIEQWQGGDIVIFARHIGIVSDRRNASGVPYVIHLKNPLQKSYEEDYLPGRTDIVGHYRMQPTG